MNKIAHKFLLTGGKFMPELHLRQPQFISIVCRSFFKHRERIQKFVKIGNLKHIYKNEFDKACFSHDVAFLIVKI